MVNRHDKDTGRETNKVDFLETWKSLENIGYQVLYNHVINTVEDAGGLSRDDNPEFYKYIYEKYIDPEGKMGGLDAEVKRLRPTAEKTIKEFVKRGIANKYEQNDLIENEISRLILYKSLAGVLRQRMPTKFLLLERDRFVKGERETIEEKDGGKVKKVSVGKGNRSWQKILTEMENETGAYKVKDVKEYNELIDDLILVENQIRGEVTQQMDEHLKTQGDFAKLNLTSKYLVDEPTIRRILEGQVPEDQINKVVKLHEKIMNHHGDDTSLYEWGDKIRWVDGRGKWIKARDFAFSVASEETELKYLSFINVGEKMLHNTLSEVALGEESFKGIQEWVDALKTAATDGKQDFGPLIEAINKVKSPISNIENSDYATKWAYYLAQATVSFFRRDSLSKIIGANVIGAGQVHSMAGEVVGPFRSAWQWTTEDQRNFYFQLEKLGVLPRTAQTFKDVNQYDKPVKTYITIPFTNKKIYTGEKRFKKRHTSYTSDQARRLSGSTKKELFFEGLNTYLPLFLIFMLYTYISKAAKEEFGGEKRG
jgi:hypothetical protein